MAKKLMLVIAAAVAAFGAWASMENVGGYVWTYRINGGTAEIYGTSSSLGYCTPAVSPRPTGAVTIPITLGGKPVTSIGNYAFDGCSGLTSVTIPDSVTSIGYDAFRDCSRLTSVYITDLAKWCDISFYDYSANPLCYARNLYLNGEKVVNLTIPDGVTSIRNYAFYGCSGLTSVTIPDGVTSIGSSAFRGCSGLTSVTIGNSVTSIGYEAFSGCSSLTSVYITDLAKWCGISFGNNSANPLFCARNLYLNGEKVVNLTIPDGVTSIGYMAFCNCSRLTSVMIPDSVTSIGYAAFSGCNATLYDTTTIPGVKLVDGWVVDDNSPSGDLDLTGVRGIADSAFLVCSGLTSVTIPDSVTSIGEQTFNGCSGLTSVTIPDSVTSIGSSAFRGCSGLTSVTIPDGVMSIGESAFSGCSGLTSVTIPDSVTSIGKQTFNGCSGLTSVTIPDSVTSIGSSAFYGCSGLTSVTIPDGVMSIGEGAFSGCSGLTAVWLPKRFRGRGSMGIGSSVALYYDRFTAIVQDRRIEAEDAGESSIELLATNACRVTFDWKCSCEPLRKGQMYDYLAFSIDGVRQEVICGEVGWTNQTYVIEGEGKHVLKWTYTKDESGAEGEDCGWIRCVSIAAPVMLTFLPGGADGGEAPAAMSFYQDDGTVSLPRQGTLAWPKHAFLGWSDGETVFKAGADYPCDAEAATLTATWERKELPAPVVTAPATFYQGETATVSISAGTGSAIHYTLDGAEPTAESPLYTGPFAVSETATIRAIAVRDDYFDSPEATFTTTKDATTFGDAVNCPFLGFAPYDGTGWRLVRGESPDGWALRSGVVSHSQTSRVETVVSGEGIVTFSFKVAGEVVKGDVYDGFAFLVDGVQQGELAGNADWTTNSVSIAGDGEHTLSWLYVKDASDDETVEGDCAWLDEVSWVSTRTVTVTLDANGGVMGEAADALRIRANEPVGELPAPMREGWTFLGWYTAAEGGERVTAETVIPNDATFYARWMVAPAKTYTITYAPGSYGSGSQQTATKTQGVALELKGAIFTRTGYTQTGWTTSDDGTKAYDLFALYKNDAAMTLYPFWKAETVPGGGESGQDIDFPAAKDWEYVSYNGEALIVGRDRSNEGTFHWLSLPDPCKELETGYSLPNDDYASAIASDTAGAVAIPAIAGGLPVTTIGTYAFCTCSNVTAITIPASVKHVAAGAFNGCKSLEKISVASGNTAYKIENGLLLTADGKRIVAAPRQIETVAIPAGVEYIDDYAFFGCGKITDVAIPEGVVGIGLKAFFGCKSLVRVSLPSTFDDFYEILQGWGYWEHEEIGWDEETGPEYKWTWEGDEWWEDHPLTGGAVYYPDAEGDFMPTDYNIAFGCCKSLLSIEVAAGNKRYKSVGGILSRKEDNAIVCFPGGLKTAEIKSPVAMVGAQAFYGNVSLKSLVIGESVKYVDSEAFLGCASLTNVVFKRKNAGNRIYFCDYGHFARCTSLERISLPEGMKNHHIYSSGGKGSEDETFDDYSYPQIASSMFQHCHELKDVKLPDTLEGIGEYAFASCWKLEKIAIPANVTYLEQGAFKYCERLRKVDFKGKPDDVDLNDFLAELLETDADWLQWELESVFGQTSWILSFTPFELYIENGVLLGFQGCCPEELAIPKGVTEIGDSAFDYDENVSVLGLKKITFPSGLKRVGKWAFFWAGLENVVLPEGVTELDEGAFLSCTNMVSLSLPQSLTALSPSAFRNCGSLREIVIPKGVTEFGERALAYCVGLEKIVFKGNAPKCGENAFLEVNPSCIVYVPKGSSGWGVSIPSVWNGLRIKYAVDDGTIPTPTPTPTPAPSPTSESVIMPELYDETEIVGSAPTAAASVYDGYLYDKTTGALAGTIQIKVGKPNAKTDLASVKATVVVGGAKKSLKAEENGKAAVAGNGPTTVVLAGGEPCEVTLGAEGLSGFYGAYAIDGSRNFFTSKDKSEANAANDVIAQWIGVVNVVWDGGVASVSIAKKGKVKASVTLANGTKAAANTQLLVGDEWLCVPVVVTKKANIAFTLWLPRGGGEVVVDGLPDGADAGKAGALKSGAAFKFDASALASALGDATYAAQLPDGLSVEQDGKKWVVAGGAKAGKVQLAKGAASPADIDEAKAGANPSALKLTYKAKDGTFKGTFKAYTLVKGKPKATTVNVSGILVGDKGYGTLSVKKPSIGLAFEIK